MRKRTLAAAAALLILAAVVANLLMMSTTAQPIEQDEAVTEKLAQTYVTRMPEPVIRQEEPERDMSVWTEAAAYIAKTVYGEAMVCGTTERAAVVWCILNRADDARDATPAGVIAVVTKPYQFHGYAADHPLLPELEGYALQKKTDEEHAAKCEAAEVKTHDFGWALSKLRCGWPVRRRGWNGKGIFIKLQVPDEHSKMTSPYIYIDTTGLRSNNPDAPRSCVPWLASQTDMLAEDWEIAEVRHG